VEDLFMFDRSSRKCTLFLALAIASALSAAARAATISPKVKVNFDGALTGTAYTLAAGELDVTGTFQANGSATIADGIADIPGDVDDTSGFYFDKTSLGDLTIQDWVMETVMILDVPTTMQPGAFNHFLDVQGDLFIRVANASITEFGYWDGFDEPRITTPDLANDQYSHVALTWNSSAFTLEAYINGLSQGTVSTGFPFEVLERVLVGYGFFARFLNRAIDGKLDAVAFSTFTGEFNPATDFQLSAPGVLFGDYDNDHDVDAADFLVWQSALGSSTTLPNDETPGFVTDADLNVWRTHFGATNTAAAARQSIPEAAAGILALMGVCMTPRRRKRRLGA
jgi:hypothetical protein